MKRFLSVIFAISACFGTASAEAVLSLDSCRNMAIRNNKSLKIAEANAKAASYNRKSAFANYFPTIDVSGGYLYSSKEVSLLNDGQKSLLPNLGSQMSTPIAGYLKQLAAVDPALAAKLAPLANGLGDAMNGIGSSLVDALRTDTRNMWGGMVSLTQPIFTGGKIIAYNRITKYAEEIAEKQKEEEQKVSAEEEVSDEVFAPGDAVTCGSMSARGEVVSSTDKDVVVMLENGLRMTLRKTMVHHAERTERKAVVSYTPSAKKADYTIDVRGCTLEEALRRLDDQIEAAILSSLGTFSIIHGFGDGILSKGIHKYLSGRREVKDFYFAHPSDGGMGKTYVELF